MANYLQRNSLYLGDTIELMKQIEPESIDGIIADLPFGVTKNIWDKPIPFEPLRECYKRIIKPNAPIILNAQQPFTSRLIMSNLAWFRYTMVWKKKSPKGFFNAKKMPLRGHEDIVVFYQNPPEYFPQKTTGHKRKVSTAVHKRNCNLSTNYGNSIATTYDSTERYPTSVLEFGSDTQKSKINPTQKPVALVEWFVLSFTKPGDLILDNTCGSGTTGVACKKNGRDFILIDNDPNQISKATERIFGNG